MLVQDRTSQEWFEEATRAYIERHQACAWCGAAHTVSSSHRDSQQVYHCLSCDFQVSHAPIGNVFFHVAGGDPINDADSCSDV